MIHVDIKNNIYTIIIDNPPVNALSVDLIFEVTELLEEILEKGDCRGMIMSSSHKHFSAGADLNERSKMNNEQTIDTVYSIKKLTDFIESLPFPTISCISGACLGGGLEIALACDFRLSDESAVFALPECSIGVIPGGGGTQRLPRLIGPSKAKRMIFSGEKISSKVALDYGLIDEILTSNMIEGAINFLKTISKNSQLSVSLAKKCINDGLSLTLKEGLNLEFKQYIKTLDSPERKKHLKKYLKK